MAAQDLTTRKAGGYDWPAIIKDLAVTAIVTLLILVPIVAYKSVITQYSLTLEPRWTLVFTILAVIVGFAPLWLTPVLVRLTAGGDKAAADGNPKAIRFPRGLTLPKDMEKHRYDFSFSGLKTAVARWVEVAETKDEPFNVADVAASFREAVADVLVTKAVNACLDHKVPRLLLGGGVVANARLRELAQERCDANGIELRIPSLSLCTDNGAMIAAIGAQLIMAVRAPSSLHFGVDSTLPVTTVQTQ